MSTFTNLINETYHIVDCYTCGVNFGVTSHLYRRAVEHKRGVLYCPACGKGSCWTGETKDQKKINELKRRLELTCKDTEREMIARKRAEYSLRATKGALTKIKNRAGRGVCPCCNRSFKQLARHMANKHPEYLTQDNP